jgi:flavin-dependent dehydrogenase
MSETEYDAVIVGTGPAGISAAWPLVDAGLKVAIIEAGFLASDSHPKAPLSLSKLRRLGLPDGFSEMARVARPAPPDV